MTTDYPKMDLAPFMEKMQAIQDELDKPHQVGAKIAYQECLVGNGHRDGPIYLLAGCGVDKFNRLWKHDRDGYTMIADFSGSFGPDLEDK